MDDERTFLEDLGLAALGGLFLAVFCLLLLGGLWASWAAGTAYCLCFVVYARLSNAQGHLATVVAFTIAGAVGGVAWWSVADTHSSWWVAPALGATFSFVYAGLWQWHDWKLDR